MSEKLTQAEIDALRNAVRSGKIEEAAKQQEFVQETGEEVKVVAYDFRKPKLLSLERMATLQLLHQSLVKSLQGMFFTMFKISGESSLAALEQVTYGEYVLSLETPTYIIGLNVGPDIGSAGVEMSPPMGQILLDYLLGGDGVEAASEPPHEFSAFEMEIMQTLSDRLLEELTQSWQSLYEVSFSVQSHGVTPEQVQITPPDTPCLIAAIDLQLNETSVRMHVCYPFRTLQAIFERSEAGREEPSGKRSEIRQQVLRAMQEVPLPVDIELGRASITARDVDNLAVGDIIRLDHLAGDPLLFNINGRPVGKAYAGAHRGRLAACVSHVSHIKEVAAAKSDTPPPPRPAPAPRSVPASAAASPLPPRPPTPAQAAKPKGTSS